MCKLSNSGGGSTHLPSAYSKDPAARWAAASSDMALERLPLPLTGLQDTSATLSPAGKQCSQPEARSKPTARGCVPHLKALLGDQVGRQPAQLDSRCSAWASGTCCDVSNL